MLFRLFSLLLVSAACVSLAGDRADLPGEAGVVAVAEYRRQGDESLKRNDNVRARMHFQSALNALRKQTDGEDKPGEMVDLYRDLAATYATDKNYVLARSYIRRALDINLKYPDETLASTAGLYLILGAYDMAEKEFEPALAYYKKALDIHTRLDRKDYDEIANLYSLQTITYMAMGDISSALSSNLKAMKAIADISPEDRSLVAKNWEERAYIYYLADANDEALKYFKQAISVYEEDEVKTREARLKLHIQCIAMHEKVGQYEQALPHYEKKLALQLKMLGEEHPDTALTYAHMAVCQAETKRSDEAIRNFEKALDLIKHYPSHNESAIQVRTSIYQRLLDIYAERRDEANIAKYNNLINHPQGGEIR